MEVAERDYTISCVNVEVESSRKTINLLKWQQGTAKTK
jgi:hypothetical protein